MSDTLRWWTPEPQAPSAVTDSSNRVAEFYDQRAAVRSGELSRFYHKLLARHFVFLVPPGLRVLELGCGLGDLLAAVRPARGVGVDLSAAMIERAKRRHPRFEFHVADAVEFAAGERFDYIILSDLINELPDVQCVFAHLHSLAHPRTRVVVNVFNDLWRPLLVLARRLGLKAPHPPQNWLSTADLANLFYLAGWEVIRTEMKILWPVRTPLLEPVLNRWVAPLPGLRHFCLSAFQVARPLPRTSGEHCSCSVVIPARNEAGNIEAAVRRLPEMGTGTEIIFIEGGSHENTWDEIQRVALQYPLRRIRFLKQQSRGKSGAIREAFAAATGDLLFILDADLTVPPEELPKFYEVARSGRAEFVNGVRLVYPMERGAMRLLNWVANKCFGLAFSWLLGQPVHDTLCGTKVLFRRDYLMMARQGSRFDDSDPFGDFELLLGAAKLGLRIVDLPVRYRARSYGRTSIQRWNHGWQLARLILVAAGKLTR